MNKLSGNRAYSIAAAVLLVFTSAACAQLPDSDQAKMGKNFESKFSEVIKELNLTPEQQTAITLQRSQERAKSRELRTKIKDVRDLITQELNKDSTDTAQLDLLVSRLKELTVLRIEHQIQGIVALKKILTPEQFKILSEKTKHEHKRHKGGSE